MDNSADLSTNDVKEVTMGNILSSTNENDADTPDTSINNPESNNGSENLEVSIPPNPIQSPIENITQINNSGSKTNTPQLKNNETENVASSSQEKITSSVEENMDWLDGKTSELVKEDNEEDFDVIVKSLETAIETEHYESASIIQEPVISSIKNTETEDLDDSPMPSLVEMMEETDEIVENVETSVPSSAPQTDCIPSTDNMNQSTNLIETQAKEIAPPQSSFENFKKETNVTTTLEIDPDLSESSIVSASTEDNEEILLLSTTVESSESDFTLHLEEEQEIRNPTTSKDHKNNPESENPANQNEKSNVLDESGDIKISPFTSIVDYDDSSEEEEEDIPTEAVKNKEKCAENDVPINLDLVDTKSEETSKIVDAIKLVEKKVLDDDKSTPILIENLEEEKSTDNVKVDDVKVDDVKVQESKDKFTPEINTKEDILKITKVSIDQPEIISEVKIVENVTSSKIEPSKNTTIKEIIEVNPTETKMKTDEEPIKKVLSESEIKSVEIKLTESKKDKVKQSIEISNKDATTSDESDLKLENDQNLEIKNVAEKIMMSLEDSEEKPRTPPKKIKLIRQKLPNVVKVASIKESTDQMILPETSSPIENKTIQESIKKTDDANVKSEEEISDIKLEESFESDEKLFSDIFKIEDEVENKPVKTQKLKLKRNYAPPVVCKSQVLHSFAKNADVEQPLKTTENVVKQAVEAVKKSVKELIEPAGEPVKITVSAVKEPVKISASVEEPAKIIALVEEPVKITTPVKEVEKIVAPVEELVKNTSPAKEPSKIVLKVAAPVQEIVKIASPVEERVKNTAPVEEPSKIVAPVEEIVKIAGPVEEIIKIAAPVEEPVKNTAPVKEPSEIVAPVEEIVKVSALVEEPVKVAAPVKEPSKIVSPVQKIEKISSPVEEVVKVAPPVIKPVKSIAPVKEPSKIVAPVEEIVKVAALVEEPVKVAAPIKEFSKIVAPVEEIEKIASPVEEIVKVAPPVIEPVKSIAPVKEPPKIVAPVEEIVKIAAPVEEIVKIAPSVEEIEKISASVIEPVKNIAPVKEPSKIVAPVEEIVKIALPVEEIVKLAAPVIEPVKNIAPVKEPSKIVAFAEEIVKIVAPVEETVKVAAPVKEPSKTVASVEEIVKIAAPLEEIVKITAPLEEIVKVAAPVEEIVKVVAPVEEPAQNTVPAKEPSKIITPVEEIVKIAASDEVSVKHITPVEEPSNIVAPVEESVKVADLIAEPVKIVASIETDTQPLEEPIKIDEAIEEPTKVDETVENTEKDNSVKEIFKASVETIEPVSKKANIEKEQLKIEESVSSTPEDEIIEQTDNLIIEKVLEPVTKPETVNEEIICETKEVHFENVTSVENEETLKPISSTEMIDEVDKIMEENNINIIETSLTENLLKKDESEPAKQQTVQIEKESGKVEEQYIQISTEDSINQNKEEHIEINQELQEDVKETLQVSEVLVTRAKTPEPIISKPENTKATETIEKEVILEPEMVESVLVKDVIEKSDSNLETEKTMVNLPETITETENVLVEKTDTIPKIESIPASVIEEVNVAEKNQKEVDIPATRAEIRAFETIIPITEKSQETTSASPLIELNVEKIIEKPSDKVEVKEKEKIEPESKKAEEIQFPLLMSRLQDKLHASMSKTGKNVGRSFPSHHMDIQKAEKSVTIEPETSTMKFRAMKRKHEPEAPSSRSITKPLTVEIDDLESSDAMMQPSEHENIPKLVIKQMPKQEQRSSPKITIKPIKPPGSPEVSSKRSKMSEGSPNTLRLTIKPVIKPDPLKITITKQTDDTHSILKIYQPEEDLQNMADTPVQKSTKKSIQKSEEMQHSPKITIKPVKPPGSPKVTVKPILPPGDQNMERSHSPKVTVKPVINPEENYPKVTIKPVLKPEEHKMTQMSPRQVKLKSMTFDSSSGVTVEPICGTSSSSIPSEHENPMKISVKNFAKIEESCAPKLTIKPLTKTCEIVQSEDGTANPLKLTIKPILKPEESYQSPKITIKPIVKPDDHEQHSVTEETVADKPERIILKIQKTNLPSPKERTSSHVRKEPDMKIEAIPPSYNPEQNQKLDKIKLKLTKEGSHAQIIPSITTSHALTDTHTSFSLKRTIPITNSAVQEKRQKSEFSELLHSSDISINLVEPHSRQNVKQISEEVTIMKIDKPSNSGASNITSGESMSQMRLKEMLLKISQKPDITCTPHVKQIQQIQREESSSSDDVRIVEVMEDPLRDPLNEDSSSQDVLIINEVIDTNPFKNVQIINAQTIVEPVQQQFTPKKRGRPRKVPLEVRPEIKGEDCILSEANTSASESPEGGRPKRTCRAPAGRTPFAVKERKPRGSGRGRGSTRGVRGAKALTPLKLPKEPKSPRGKALKVAKALAKLEAAKLAQEVIIDEITIEDSTNETLASNTPIPIPLAEPEAEAGDFLKKPEIDVEMQMQMQTVEPHKIEMKMSEMSASISEIADVKNTSMSEIKNTSVSVYEEETRMSASENNSRAQTPARQVFIVPLSAEGPEESQSSVQSSATTESTKNKKGRLEICDPDSAHTTVEQIVEYAWGNGGPYMLQEQIAQFLGVKSFKRKYPGLTRRPVDMQERDYIKEKGLVSESMCDMGLTAVPSSEILDIMYTDFQEKYEEYRKCLRDKQSKEISNKQKAISLATSQEKNKLDFKERAIRSSANWNATFNKSRKETRKCCMDLQTYTVNYPTGKNYPRVPHKNPVGSYPIALVPGQFTDYFKAYSTNELNYLPLNTVRYGPMLPNQRCLEASDGSSESDSSSGSDSDSSDESMSTDDEAPSTPVPAVPVSKHLTPLLSTTPKTKVH